MKTIKAFIERGDDQTYNVYIKDDLLFGFFGEGKTIEDAKEDFIESYAEMKGRYEQTKNKKANYIFTFEYDVESFLKHYSKVFSKPALEHLTGINQKQLHHYATGIKKPREAQRKKIENALHKLGNELLAVKL